MSLLNPHLGELLDRYSILTMKVLETSCPTAFQAELNEITAAITMKTVLLPGEVMFFAAELGAINGRIWELVAQAHRGQEFSSVLLQRLNERRNACIARLGELGGAQAVDVKVF